MNLKSIIYTLTYLFAGIISNLLVKHNKKYINKICNKFNGTTPEGTNYFTPSLGNSIYASFQLIGICIGIILTTMILMLFFNIGDELPIIEISIFFIIIFTFFIFLMFSFLKQISFNQRGVCFKNIITKRQNLFEYSEISVKQKHFAIFIYARNKRIPINTQNFTKEELEYFEKFCLILQEKIQDRYEIIN